MQDQVVNLKIDKYGAAIFLFGDLQWGAKGFDEDAWAQFKDEFLTTPNAVAIGLGDYCYSPDTEFLTKQGWKRFHQWRPGMKVLCFDIENKKSEYRNPSKLWINKYSGEMLNFKSRYFDILVTPNHKMVINQVEKKEYIGHGLKE